MQLIHHDFWHGLDSLKIVAKNINDYKDEHKDTSILIITHYTHLLKYIKPDYVHVLIDGKIIKTGNYRLAKEIEDNGFNFNKIESSVNTEGDHFE